MQLTEASHILVCSERDKKEIIKEVPDANKKITIIPNCVNFEEYNNYLKTESKDFKIKILFMGLLSYSPNIDAVNHICNRNSSKF